MIEVAAPGFEELRANGIFGATFGIDVDRDARSGNTSFWPEFHLLGPDIELHLFEEYGEVVAEGFQVHDRKLLEVPNHEPRQGVSSTTTRPVSVSSK